MGSSFSRAGRPCAENTACPWVPGTPVSSPTVRATAVMESCSAPADLRASCRRRQRSSMAASGSSMALSREVEKCPGRPTLRDQAACTEVRETKVSWSLPCALSTPPGGRPRSHDADGRRGPERGHVERTTVEHACRLVRHARPVEAPQPQVGKPLSSGRPARCRTSTVVAVHLREECVHLHGARAHPPGRLRRRDHPVHAALGAWTPLRGARPGPTVGLEKPRAWRRPARAGSEGPFKEAAVVRWPKEPPPRSHATAGAPVRQVLRPTGPQTGTSSTCRAVGAHSTLGTPAHRAEEPRHGPLRVRLRGGWP